jgi:hypothetical protein
MSTRNDIRKDVNALLPDLRAIQYNGDGQLVLKYLKLKQTQLRIDLETASQDEIYRLQGGLALIKEIISAISA